MILTHARLVEVLSYYPLTGVFVWRVTNSNRCVAGRPAGTLRPNGRWQVRIDGRIYLRARLAWFYVHAKWPSEEIDHKDCNPADDRIENLREATRSQNEANKRSPTGGIKGVYFDKRCNRYYARVKHAGKYVNLGSSKNPDEARAKYLAGARRIFGEFARAA